MQTTAKPEPQKTENLQLKRMICGSAVLNITLPRPYRYGYEIVAYVAELVQHLLAVGQVWSHELGGIHLDLLLDLPGGQAGLDMDRGNLINSPTNLMVQVSSLQET